MRVATPTTPFWTAVPRNDGSCREPTVAPPFVFEKHGADREKSVRFEKITDLGALRISLEIVQRDFNRCSPLHSTIGESS
jgi:hypothetical protein